MAKSFEELRIYYVSTGIGFNYLLEELSPEFVAFGLQGFAPSVFFGERHGSWFKSFRWTNGDGIVKILEFSLTNESPTSDATTKKAQISIRIAITSNELFYVRNIYSKNKVLNNKIEELLNSNLRAGFEQLLALSRSDFDRTYLKTVRG